MIWCFFCVLFHWWLWCCHPNRISPQRKKNWGDVCVRKIIKHRWQVKIEKSQTPKG